MNLGSIEHETSDKFITQENTNEIQNHLYIFSKWYDVKSIQKYFMIGDLNIGQLLQEQFIDYMIKFLKKFFEFKNIYEKFPNSTFISSGISIKPTNVGILILLLEHSIVTNELILIP